MDTISKAEMVVGIVLPYLKSRGTEKQALRLASGLVARGYRAVVFNIQGWGNEAMYQEFAVAGIMVIDVGPAQHVDRKKVNPLRFLRLIRMIRQQSCTVLLSRSGLANRMTCLAGRFLSIPTVAILSSVVGKPKKIETKLRRNYKSVLMHVKSGFPSRYVAVSVEGAENFRTAYPLLKEKIEAIRNGIEAIETGLEAVITGEGQSCFRICYAGSLELERKGLDLLVLAMTCLVEDKRIAPVCLILIGSGEDEPQLRKMVCEAGIEGRVSFTGDVAPPYALMKSCDVFVLPSRREGLPNSLLEAMRLGLCCVAADCDTGPREIIVDGVSGLLFPVGDAEALAETLSCVIRDNALRKRLADKGRERVLETFSFRAMLYSYESMFNRLIRRQIRKRGCGPGDDNT